MIPLPSRLQIADADALGLHNIGDFYYAEGCPWQIFQDFLNSSGPLALDERRYAIASLAALKILFGHYRAPVSRSAWFSQHSRTLRIGRGNRYQHHHKDTDFPGTSRWEGDIGFYLNLKIHSANEMRMPHGIYLPNIMYNLSYEPSKHLRFLLQKSAHSDHILDFARFRVFRFGYLLRKHPVDMKKVIFALAKYIQRVTGETAEVRACESIWGRDTSFTAQ